MHFHVQRVPEFPRAFQVSALPALEPGLQDRHQNDAVGTVVAVLVGQSLPPADVGSFVANAEQRR